jgi:hypothetical protein
MRILNDMGEQRTRRVTKVMSGAAILIPLANKSYDKHIHPTKYWKSDIPLTWPLSGVEGDGVEGDPGNIC